MVRTLAVFVVLALAGGNRAHAGVIFSLGNDPQQSGEQNILFNSDQTGSLVTGVIGSTNMIVDFSSTSDTLDVTASGQAQLAAVDGTVNNVTISLPGGATYQSLILNPFLGGSVDPGSATVTVTANDGTFTYTYPEGLEKGQNFLTITASNGERIISTTVQASTGFQDLQQPRIGGATVGTAVPEPASAALLAGGILALWLKRARHGACTKSREKG